MRLVADLSDERIGVGQRLTFFVILSLDTVDWQDGYRAHVLVAQHYAPCVPAVVAILRLN